MFRRRMCVVPTRRGWLVIALVCAILFTIAWRNAYYFLAMNSAPRGKGILVVEGWGPDVLMENAAREFKSGHYDGILTTGGSIEKGGLLTSYPNYAEMSAATFEKLGIAKEFIHAVPPHDVSQDRTYTSAIAVKHWLHNNGMKEKEITLMTMGAHARRSHLLYEKAFDDGTQIGVIAVNEDDIKPNRWWTNSQGFRSVIDESVAYFYARFLFHAPKDQ